MSDKKSKDKDFGLPSLSKTKFKPINRNIINSKTNRNNSNKRMFRGLIFSILLLLMLSLGVFLFIWIKNRKIDETDLEDIEEDSTSLFEDKEDLKQKRDESIEEVDQTDTFEEKDSELSSKTQNEDNKNKQFEKETINSEVQEENSNHKEIEEPISEKPKTGLITKIKQPQNTYFIIISSSIDEDLANDYAKKLAKKGDNVFVLYPKKDSLYHRVAISKFDTRQDANSYLKEAKKRFAGNAWIMKY
ncbi:MAG: SPOR domain-containing protein [Bacteroidetes bacterium]|nr:SPOR domain-containing protein [Bacteroidota bacterium]